MSRPTTARRRHEVTVARAAYNIPEFCEAHRISEALYYKMRLRGQGPREARVLTKVIITDEAAAEWRAKQTAAAE